MEKQWIPETGDWTRAGVTKTGQGVNFTLELPEAETAELLLFQKGEEEPEAVIPMGEKVMGDLCSIFLKGFRPERYEYAYRIGEEVFVDPRAGRISGSGIRKLAFRPFGVALLLRPITGKTTAIRKFPMRRGSFITFM